MRDTLRLTILAALFLAVGCSTYDRELMGDPEPAHTQEPAYAEQPAPADEDSLGVGMFNELDYYGQWYSVAPYGWAWRPTVVSEWQPFAHGHWIWSQYGWMWVDYDPWGWATSHYGYWAIDYAMGWIWIPDYTWSPAQCDWLWYDDTICWSPVPPSGVKFKEPWEDNKTWVSVPVRRFKDPDVGAYRVTPKFKDVDEAQNVSRATPDVREVERRGAKFSPVEVQLDRRVVGEREFAKVKFPADQEQIIAGQRARIKGNDTSARFAPVTVTQPQPISSGGNGNSVGPPKPQTESKAKSKESTPKSKDSGKKETNYKSKKSDEKKGDDKSKDDSKSGDKKDDSKSSTKGKQ